MPSEPKRSSISTISKPPCGKGRTIRSSDGPQMNVNSGYADRCVLAGELFGLLMVRSVCCRYGGLTDLGRRLCRKTHETYILYSASLGLIWFLALGGHLD